MAYIVMAYLVMVMPSFRPTASAAPSLLLLFGPAAMLSPEPTVMLAGFMKACAYSRASFVFTRAENACRL